MKKVLTAIVAATILTATVAPIPHSDAASLQQVREIWIKKMQQNLLLQKQQVLQNTMARIYVNDEFVGSGVWLDNGRILTANHILGGRKEGDEVAVEQAGVITPIKVGKIDKGKDLALLITKLSSHTHAKVATSTVKGQVGKSLSADGISIESGALLDKSIKITIDDSYGIEISSLPRDIYSFKSSLGESGSGILSENGEVIGIITGKITTANDKYEIDSCISVSLEDIILFLK